MKYIGKRIKLIRKDRNMTLKQLEERTGIHFTRLARFEKGLEIPNEKSIRNLETALGVIFENNKKTDETIENIFIQFVDLLFFQDNHFSHFTEEIKNNRHQYITNPFYYKILIIEYIILVISGNIKNLNKQENIIELTIEKATIYEQIYFEYKSVKLHQQHELEAAYCCLKDFCRLSENSKIYAMVNYHLSLYYKELNMLEEARIFIEKAKEIFIKYASYKRMVYCNMQISSIYGRLRRYDLAIEAGNTCLNSFKFVYLDDSVKKSIISNQCWIYILMNDYQNGMNMISKAEKINKKNNNISLYKAWCSYKLKKYNQARAIIYDNYHLKKDKNYSVRYLLIRDLIDLEERTPTKELIQSAIKVYDKYYNEKRYDIISFYLDIVIDLLDRKNEKDELIKYLKIKTKIFFL